MTFTGMAARLNDNITAPGRPNGRPWHTTTRRGQSAPDAFQVRRRAASRARQNWLKASPPSTGTSRLTTGT